MTLEFIRTKSYDRAMAMYNLWLDLDLNPQMSYTPSTKEYYVRFYATIS